MAVSSFCQHCELSQSFLETCQIPWNSAAEQSRYAQSLGKLAMMAISDASSSSSQAIDLGGYMIAWGPAAGVAIGVKSTAVFNIFHIAHRSALTCASE